MLDTATTARLRAVLNEVCECVSQREIGARTHVASKFLEAATKSEISPEGLRQVVAMPSRTRPRCGADPAERA